MSAYLYLQQLPLCRYEGILVVNGGLRSLIFVREKHFQGDTDCPKAVTTRLYCSREMFPIPVT